MSDKKDLSLAKVTELSPAVNTDKENERIFLIEMQKFLSLINKKPTKIAEYNVAGTKFNYVPVESLEANLDRHYFGLWSTENFKYQVVGNEITGSLDLVVFHPIAKVWVKRTGCGAVQIRCKAGSEPGLNSKIKNALQMDLPHLESECIKNACQKLGRLFGRGLRRDINEDYTPLIKDVSEIDAEVTGKLKIYVDKATGKSKAFLKTEIPNIMLEASQDGITESELQALKLLLTNIYKGAK